MNTKIIKTEAEYETALARIYALMDAEPNSHEEEELELLGLLVEKYEEEHFPIDPPDPVEAILFRMDQQGLTPKDMIKYLGSQSKVSEVLNHKRPLSLAMIRNINTGLGIPLEVLVRQPKEQAEGGQYSWQDFPFADMVKNCYFPWYKGKLSEAKQRSHELLSDLFSVLRTEQLIQVYYKQLERDFDDNALKAWQARITQIALEEKLPSFSKDDLTEKFFHQLVKLSYFEDGPRLAKEFLNKKGIHLVFLPHLPKTYLDGACFYAPDHRPLVGMTLRHDRLDNFWFTLIHELSHLCLHLDNPNLAFFDDTEQLLGNTEDPQEKDANEFAREMLIPSREWENIKHNLIGKQTPKYILACAKRLEINPAIIAGRLRWETKDYSLFSKVVGNKQVREKFPEYVCDR